MVNRYKCVITSHRFMHQSVKVTRTEGIKSYTKLLYASIKPTMLEPNIIKSISQILNVVVAAILAIYSIWFSSTICCSLHRRSLDPEMSHNQMATPSVYRLNDLCGKNETDRMQNQCMSSFICSTLIDKVHRCCSFTVEIVHFGQIIRFFFKKNF